MLRPDADPSTEGRKYLVCTIDNGVKSWGDFRWGELSSLAAEFDEPGLILDKENDIVTQSDMYAPVALKSEASATKIVDRSILSRGIYEIWGEGATLEECVQAVQAFSEDLQRPYLRASQTWCMSISCKGESVPLEEKKVIWDLFAFVKHGGEVQIRGADVNFWLIIDKPGRSKTPMQRPPQEVRYYYCREVVHNHGKYVLPYSLKTRRYIGPTSCDAELAFIMSNLGKVNRNKVVFDPFVGTGSLLIAAAVHGAYVVGCDLDWRVVHGRMRKNKHTINDNFDQYNLPRPEIVCADMSYPLWNTKEPRAPMFDAIVCDPPYGVRAGPRRSGTTKKNIKPVIHTPDNPHIPPTRPYEVHIMMCDLLDMAAKLLKVGGRLVYLLPISAEFQTDELPVHPLMSSVCTCEQVLRQGFSRLCVVLEKNAPWDGTSMCVRPPPGVIPTYAQLADKDYLDVMKKKLPTIAKGQSSRQRKRVRRLEEGISKPHVEKEKKAEQTVKERT